MILVQELKRWDLTGKEIEYIPMTWEDRQRTRQRIKTKSGLELGLTLPTGTLLQPGDVLHVEGNLAFIVAAREEDVLVIKPDDWREAALVAHHIGNQHKTIAIEPDGILVLYDLPLEVFLKKIKVTFRRELRPFKPHFQSHSP